MNVEFLKDDIVKHYKGNYYKILFISKHTETEEQLISYQRCDCKGKNATGVIWTRPASMFYEEVEDKPRFTKVEKVSQCVHVDGVHHRTGRFICNHPFAEELGYECLFTENQALCHNYKYFQRTMNVCLE